MATYKTPDVYVEEISVFPPSVAEVESAVPAFVGYTQKTTKLAAGDLLTAPVPIQSMVEFEELYGKGPEVRLTDIQIDANNNFVSSTLTNPYYLYDSLRLYFDNGGSRCYIMSVGPYAADGAKDATALRGGIDKIATKDEPTILVCPDAAALGSEDELALVQQRALAQCSALMDRVAILDTRLNDPMGESFRNKIGILDLKYGAAYTPWLQIKYSKEVHYIDVRDKIVKEGVPTLLRDITSDPGILQFLDNLDRILPDIAAIDAGKQAAAGAGKTIPGAFADLVTTYKGAKTPANLQALNAFVYKLVGTVDNYLKAGTLKHTALGLYVDSVTTNTLRPAIRNLIALEKELAAKITPATPYTPKFNAAPLPTATEWGGIFDTAIPAASTAIPAAADNDVKRLDAAFPLVSNTFSILAGVIDDIRDSADQYRADDEKALFDNFGVYANIIRGINSTATKVPPSGAMAGIYCLVDRTRGVWKSPANVSLVGVSAPTFSFTRAETDALNVDPVAGKSINAIREFPGKGTLVWGARTLAGNDNEWRYIAVRRFFNLVEESVKKSTYPFVFEGNDANTWVKVRGMIENYLTQKWREGALAGASTKDAFFVRCGLGVTMSAQDILEGRMYVEIGMAVVRPAEFIILKFMHKLQVS